MQDMHINDCVAELFSKAYFQTYRKWCEKNKVKFTGHLMEEPTLQSQCSAVGETMRCYPYLDVPGVDMLRKDMELTTVNRHNPLQDNMEEKAL